MQELLIFVGQLFLIALTSAGLFCTLIGLVTVIQWMRTPKAPSDSSNRLNNIASWWIGLTRPEVMAKSYRFFRQDVLANVEDVESKPQ